MPTPGKNFWGQKGFPTPNSTPDVSIRRIFIVPNSEEWLGLLEGAAQVLLDEWRFYDWGTLTPAETVAAFNDIIIASYTNVCACELPGGGSVLRLNTTTGRLQQIGSDGTWIEPEGDYAVPPITPREGGTPADKKCLAAANAANVLETLYESVTDSIASELEAAEAYAALVTAFIAAVGWEFAPIAFALAAFFLIVFTVAYEIIALLAADVWDGTFTETLQCALFECASVDGEGVVTFDWPCVQGKLAAGTDALNFDQIRLFNQLNFIIQVLGGADGLNLAGATTAITSADCTCNIWCHVISGSEFATYFAILGGFGSISGGLNSGLIHIGAPANTEYRGFDAILTMPSSATVTRIEVTLTFSLGTFSGPNPTNESLFRILRWSEGTILTRLLYPTEPVSPEIWTGDVTDSQLLFAMKSGYQSGSSDPGGTCSITEIRLSGTGANPFPSDNCD